MSFGVHFYKYNEYGEMLFYIMGANRKTAQKGQRILGTRPDQDGFNEDSLREFMENDLGYPPAEMDVFINAAKAAAPKFGCEEPESDQPDNDQIAS